MRSKNYPEKRIIAEVALPLPMDNTFYYVYPSNQPHADALGCKVSVSFGRKLLTGIIVRLHNEEDLKDKPELLKTIDKVYSSDGRITDEMFELSRWMADYYCCSLGEALSCAYPVKLHRKKSIQDKCAHDEIMEKTSTKKITLSTDQESAFNEVSDAIVKKENKTFLLYGVTGSGKTEVYLKLFRQVLDAGGSGIFLLPEISLTPQFVKRACEYLPGEVVLWHSRLTKKERDRAWQELALGKKRIVLGVRSAVFAPLKDIKLIVIDEEQEDTYKQDKKPMYHTREVAKKRAKYHNAAVLLGSATPDMVSYYKAQKGEYKLLTLTKRFSDVSMPDINLIDLRSGGVGRPQALISKELEAAISRALARREQIILFLNRRGFAPNCFCPECNWRAKCPRCSISLVQHEKWSAKNRPYHMPESDDGSAQLFSQKIKPEGSTGQLRCHLCGYFSGIPKVCPDCSSARLVLFGLGTQKLEKELRRLFPEARMFRMDYDTTKERDIHSKIYNDFLNEKFDILFGTQMISKGFDFPRVTLVGIVDADMLMHLPDFRAAEKTFRMIVQVAGRAGRKELTGRVLVQTYSPEHFVMQMAKSHDYSKFYNEDIKSREMFAYPPFTSLINVIMHGKKEEEVSKAIAELAGGAESVIKNKGLGDSISGPSPAVRPLVKHMYRYQMVIKIREQNKVMWSKYFKSIKLKSNLRIAVDIDPQSLF